jgi:hypothetical protein
VSRTTPPSFTPDDARRGPDDDTLRRDFLAEHPPEAFFAAVDQARARRGWAPLRPLTVGLATAGLAATLLLVLLPSTAPGLRDKGRAPGVTASAHEAATLGFAIKRADEVLPGRPGLACHPGDHLRLLASQQDWSYGLALSVDAHGAVEVLHAAPDGHSLPLVRGRDVPLPGSRELDDYVGPEWYWLVVSNRPLAASTVAEAARRATLDHVAKGGRPGDLSLPVEEGARALGFWIEKR